MTKQLVNAKYIWYIFSLLIVSFFLWLRYPDGLINPQLWAEDGTVFFLGAYTDGIKSITMPYAGYIHLIPRIFACIASMAIPFEFIPFFYSYSSLSIVFLLVTFIYTRTPFDNFTNFLLSISPVVLPMGNEIVLNITNIQWFSAVAILVIFISTPKRKFLALDIIVLILTCLTGPFCILFAPAIILMLYINHKLFVKEKIFWPIALCYLTFCLIQLTCLMQSERISSKLNLIDKALALPHLLYLQFVNLSGLEFLYTPQTNYIVLLIILIALSLLAFTIIKNGNSTVLFLCSSCFLFLLAHLLTFNATIYMLHPIFAGTRYFYIPMICTIWSLILIIPKPNYRFLLMPLFIYYGYLVIYTIDPKVLPDKKWKLYTSDILDSKKTVVKIPINPEGWEVIIKK